MGRHWDLMCGLSEQENSLKIPYRPSEESEKSIRVPRQHQIGCGCKHPCKCNPCHCNGFAIDPNTVTLVASVAPPVLMMPSERSEKSVEVEREGIHPKTREEHRSREVGHPSKTRNDGCQCWVIMDILQPAKIRKN